MPKLWDGILGFFGDIKDFVYNSFKSVMLWRLKDCPSVSTLNNVLNSTPEPWKSDPDVVAYYNGEKERLLAQGKETISDIAFGEFTDLAKALFYGFKGLSDEMQTDLEESVKETVVKGSPGITDVFKGKLDMLLDGVLSAIDPDEKKIPKEVRDGLKDTMSPILGLGITFSVGTALAELIHPTKEMGWGRVSHFLYDTVGMKSFMDAYTDPIRLNLITMPTKYAVNRLTTPFAPRFADAMEWYGRGHIDEDEFQELREKAGIESKWDYRYYRMGTKPSSYFMLNAIAREGFWDADDFKFWLSDAGYGAFKITKEWFSPYEKKYGLKEPSTSQIDFLLGAYKQMNLRSTVGDVRGIRRKLMLDGWITREDFEKELGKYKITKEDAKDVLDAIEEEQDVKDKKELQKAYEKKYLYGRIGKEELEKKLGELGIREGRIKSRVAYLFARKEGKLDAEIEGKTLTRAQVVAAYKDGRKDKGWAVKQLDDMGYTIEDATLQAEDVDQDVKNATRDEWFRAFETRTLNGRMSIEELQKKYVELGKKPEWAEARAAYIHERLLGKEEAAA